MLLLRTGELLVLVRVHGGLNQKGEIQIRRPTVEAALFCVNTHWLTTP